MCVVDSSFVSVKAQEGGKYSILPTYVRTAVINRYSYERTRYDSRLYLLTFRFVIRMHEYELCVWFCFLNGRPRRSAGAAKEAKGGASRASTDAAGSGVQRHVHQGICTIRRESAEAKKVLNLFSR